MARSATQKPSSAQHRSVKLRVSNDAVFYQYMRGVRGTNIPLLYTSEPFDNSLAALRNTPDGRERCIDCYVADELVDPSNPDPRKRRLSWVAYVDSGIGMDFEAMERWGFRGAEPVLEKAEKGGSADETHREANKMPCLIDADLSQHGQGSHITAFLQAYQMVIVSKTAGSEEVLELVIDPDEYGQESADLPCDARPSLKAQGKAWADAETLIHGIPRTRDLKQLPELLAYWEEHGSSEAHARRGQKSWKEHSFTAFVFLNLRCGKQHDGDMYNITPDDKAYESFFHSFNRIANEIKTLYFFQLGFAPAFGAFFGGHMHATANACHASDKGVIYEQGARKPVPRDVNKQEMHVSFHVFALWNDSLPALKEDVQTLRRSVDPDVEAAQGIRFVDVSDQLKEILEGLDSVAAEAPPHLSKARWRHRKLNALPYPGWPLHPPTERWHRVAEDKLSHMARIAMTRVVELKRELEPPEATALERLRTFPIALRHSQWRNDGDLPMQMMLQYFPVYRSEQSLDRILGMRGSMTSKKADDPEVLRLHNSMPLFPDERQRFLFWWNGRLQGHAWGLGEKVLPIMQLDQPSLKAIERSQKYKRLLDWIPVEKRDAKSKDLRERNKSLAKLIAHRIAGHVFLQDYKRRRGETSDARKYRKERETLHAADGSMIKSGPSEQECKVKHQQEESFVTTDLYDPGMYLQMFLAAGEVYNKPRFAVDLEDAALKEFDAQAKASDVPRSLSMARLDVVVWILSAKDKLDEEVTLHALIDNQMFRSANVDFIAESDKRKIKFGATQPEMRDAVRRLYKECHHRLRVLKPGDLVFIDRSVKLHSAALKSGVENVPNMPAQKRGEWGVIHSFFDQRDVGVPHVVYKPILCQKHWELADEDGSQLDSVPDCYKLVPVSACKMYQLEKEPAGKAAMKEWLTNERSGIDAHVPKQLQVALWPADLDNDGPDFPSPSYPLRGMLLPDILVGLACGPGLAQGPDKAWLVSDFAGPSFTPNSAPAINSLDVTGTASQVPEPFVMKCHLLREVRPGVWDFVRHTAQQPAAISGHANTHPCAALTDAKAFRFSGVGNLQPGEYMIAFTVQHKLLAAAATSPSRTRTQASGSSSRSAPAASRTDGPVNLQFSDITTGVYKTGGRNRDPRFIWSSVPQDNTLKKLVFDAKGFTPSAVLKFKVAPGVPTSMRLTSLHLSPRQPYYLGADKADERPDTTPTVMHTGLDPESWPQLRVCLEVIDSNGMPCVDPEIVLAFVREHIATCVFDVRFRSICAPPTTSVSRLPSPFHVHVATDLLSADDSAQHKLRYLVSDRAGESALVILPAYLTPSRELLDNTRAIRAFVMSRWCPEGASEARKDLEVDLVMTCFAAADANSTSQVTLNVLPGFAASLEFENVDGAAVEVENGSCLGGSSEESGRLCPTVRVLDAYGFPATLTVPDANVAHDGHWLHGILSRSGSDVPFCAPNISVKETVTAQGGLAEVPVDTDDLQRAWQLDLPRSRFKLNEGGLRLQLLSNAALQELQETGRVPASLTASLYQVVKNRAHTVAWPKLQRLPRFKPTADGQASFEPGPPPTVSQKLVITPRPFPTQVLIRDPSAVHPDPSEPRLWRITADAGAEVTATIELLEERGIQVSDDHIERVLVTPTVAVTRYMPTVSPAGSASFQLRGLLAPPCGNEPRVYAFEVWWGREVDGHGKTRKEGYRCEECCFTIELAAKPPPPTRWALKPRHVPAAATGRRRGSESPVSDVHAGSAIPALLLFREDDQGNRCTEPLEQDALPVLQARWNGRDISAQLQVAGTSVWQPPLAAGDDEESGAAVGEHAIVLSDEANKGAASTCEPCMWEVNGVFVGGTLHLGRAGEASADEAPSAMIHLSVKSDPSSDDGLAPSSDVQIRLHPGEANLLTANVALPTVCHLRLPFDNSDLRVAFTDAWHNFSDPLDVHRSGNHGRNAMASGAATLTLDATLHICTVDGDVITSFNGIPFIPSPDARCSHVYVFNPKRAPSLKLKPEAITPGRHSFRLAVKRKGGNMRTGPEMSSELIHFVYGAGPFVSKLKLEAHVRTAGQTHWAPLFEVRSVAANAATELRVVVAPLDEKKRSLFSDDAGQAAALMERLATAASTDDGQEGELLVTLYRPNNGASCSSHAPVTLDYDSVRVNEGVVFLGTVDLRHVGKYKISATYKEPDRSIRQSMLREIAVNHSVQLEVVAGQAAQLCLEAVGASEQAPCKLRNMGDAVDNELLLDVRALDAYGNVLPVSALRPQSGGQGGGRHPVDPMCLQVELVPSEGSSPAATAQPVHTEALYKANPSTGGVCIAIQPIDGSGVGQHDGGRMDVVVKHLLPASSNDVEMIQSRLCGVVVFEDLQSRSEAARLEAVQLAQVQRARDLQVYTKRLQQMAEKANKLAGDLGRMVFAMERVSQTHCTRLVQLLRGPELQPLALRIFGNAALEQDLDYQGLVRRAQQHNRRGGLLDHLTQELERQQRSGATVFGRRMAEMRDAIMNASPAVFGMAGDLLAFNEAKIAEVVQCSALFDEEPLTAEGIRAVLTNYLSNKFRYTFSMDIQGQKAVVQLCKARKYRAASTQLNSCSSASQVEAYASRHLNLRNVQLSQQLSQIAAAFFSMSELFQPSEYFWRRCQECGLEQHYAHACAVGIISKVIGRTMLHIGIADTAIEDRDTLRRRVGAGAWGVLQNRDTYTLKDALRIEADNMCHIDGGRALEEARELQQRLTQARLRDWDVQLASASSVTQQAKDAILRHCTAASYSASLHAKANIELTTARRVSEDEAPRLQDLLQTPGFNMAHLKDTVDRELTGLLSDNQYARWTSHLTAWTNAVQDPAVLPASLALTADADTPRGPGPAVGGPNMPRAGDRGAAAGTRASGAGQGGQASMMQRLAAQAQQSPSRGRGRGRSDAGDGGPANKRHRMR